MPQSNITRHQGYVPNKTSSNQKLWYAMCWHIFLFCVFMLTFFLAIGAKGSENGPEWSKIPNICVTSKTLKHPIIMALGTYVELQPPCRNFLNFWINLILPIVLGIKGPKSGSKLHTHIMIDIYPSSNLQVKCATSNHFPTKHSIIITFCAHVNSSFLWAFFKFFKIYINIYPKKHSIYVLPPTPSTEGSKNGWKCHIPCHQWYRLIRTSSNHNIWYAK